MRRICFEEFGDGASTSVRAQSVGHRLAYADDHRAVRLRLCGDQFRAACVAGILLTPQSQANEWGRDVFGLAIAIQNIVWGLGQPLAGMLADRFGVIRVLWGGAIIYTIGLAMMAYATTPMMLNLSAGVFIGLGLAGCGFSVVLAAFGKLLPERMRSLAFGAGAAAGSFGQFLYSPLAVSLIDSIGWQETLLTFAVLMLLILPFSMALATGGKRVLGKCSTRSRCGRHCRKRCCTGLSCYWCSVFLPVGSSWHSSPSICRPISSTRDWPAGRRLTLAVIGLFNIFGSLTSGWLGTRMPKRYILSVIYFGRALAILGVYPASGDGRDRDRLRRRDGLPLALDRGADAGTHCPDVRHALARDARRCGVLQPSGRRLPRRVARWLRVRADRLLRSRSGGCRSCSACCRP